MPIIKGLLKNKTGSILHPETSFDKVKDDDSKTLKQWRSEIDTSITELDESYSGLVDESGIVKMEKLPAVLNKFKGNFANEAALPQSGEAGDMAICSDTDTVWVWDAEKSGAPGWIDTGKKGNVTSVNGKTGQVVITIEDIAGLQAAIDAKVATSAIVNDLTTGGATVPLSAEQGKTLKTQVDAAQSAASSAQSAADAAQETANEIDFAVVANGGPAPENLRENGLYFEMDADAEG